MSQLIFEYIQKSIEQILYQNVDSRLENKKNIILKQCGMNINDYIVYDNYVLHYNNGVKIPVYENETELLPEHEEVVNGLVNELKLIKTEKCKMQAYIRRVSTITECFDEINLFLPESLQIPNIGKTDRVAKETIDTFIKNNEEYISIIKIRLMKNLLES